MKSQVFVVNNEHAINTPPARLFTNLAAAEEWVASETALHKLAYPSAESPYSIEVMDLFDLAAEAGSDNAEIYPAPEAAR